MLSSFQGPAVRTALAPGPLSSRMSPRRKHAPMAAAGIATNINPKARWDRGGTLLNSAGFRSIGLTAFPLSCRRMTGHQRRLLLTAQVPGPSLGDLAVVNSSDQLCSASNPEGGCLCRFPRKLLHCSRLPTLPIFPRGCRMVPPSAPAGGSRRVHNTRHDPPVGRVHRGFSKSFQGSAGLWASGRIL